MVEQRAFNPWTQVRFLVAVLKLGVAQSGSALRLDRRGRWFESNHPDCVVNGRKPKEKKMPEVLGNPKILVLLFLCVVIGMLALCAEGTHIFS